MLNDKKVIKKNHTIQKKHIMRSIKRNASVSPLTENRSYPGAHVIDIWFLSVSVIKLLVWKKKKIQKKPSAKNTQNLKKSIFFSNIPFLSISSCLKGADPTLHTFFYESEYFKHDTQSWRFAWTAWISQAQITEIHFGVHCEKAKYWGE